jgi:hypothetical protein
MPNTKVHRPQGGDQLVVESGGSIQVKTGGKILPNGGTQAATIATLAAITGGDAPTEAEHNALRVAVNSITAALIAVGVLAAS